MPRTRTTFSTDSLLHLTSMVDTDCAPCAALTADGAQIAPVTPSNPTSTAPPRWEGVIGVEGQMTGDGRLIEKNALRWENLPIPFRMVAADVGFHDGAVVVGTVDKISRGQGGKILGEGTLDVGSAYGVEAQRLIDANLQNGVSMDLDDVSFEVRVAAELLDDAPLGGLLAADGKEILPDKDGRVKVMEIGSDDEVHVTTDGRIRAATLVAIPAFADAQVHMAALPAGEAPVGPGGDCSCTEGDPNYDPDCECPDAAADPQGDLVLAASAIPVAPPAAWFNNPGLTAPTGLTVTRTGRVYGHIASWGTCHISHTQSGCVTAPHSETGYAHFLTGMVLTAEGAQIPIGHLTMNTRHAGDRLTAAAALSHYEDTGKVAADVTVGEDEHGIWFAGALRPTLTDAQIREFRAAPISGDWRRLAGNLEMIAALAVNVPGFPIPRPSGLVAAGAVQSLVASGILPPRLVRLPGTPNALSDDDLRYLKRLADRERQAESVTAAVKLVPDAAEMARRVRASSLSMRVHRPGKD